MILKFAVLMNRIAANQRYIMKLNWFDVCNLNKEKECKKYKTKIQHNIQEKLVKKIV